MELQGHSVSRHLDAEEGSLSPPYLRSGKEASLLLLFGEGKGRGGGERREKGLGQKERKGGGREQEGERRKRGKLIWVMEGPGHE